MSFEHPYPDFAYLDLDAETNEKRWFSSKGMGVGYVHEDRVAEMVAEAVTAEREACAKAAESAVRGTSNIDVHEHRGADKAAAAIRARVNS